MSRRGWIGVDLDGTLAVYESGQGIRTIGSPIEPMVQRVKSWISSGFEVRIITARMCGRYLGDPQEADEQERLIQAWCVEHLNEKLKVTAVKDFDMVEIWDDRAIRVEKNTGRVDG